MLTILGAAAMVGSCSSDREEPRQSSDASAPLDRSVLPVSEPKPPTYSELDVRNAKAPPSFEVKAPAGAPNVIIILIDDLGFGASATYGGPSFMG